MSVHEEILGFLDGSLSAESEAELLHRMSVSPERRALLRSYFTQQSLIAQDKSSINVPFDAEQGLWSRLDSIMPAALPATMTAMSTGTAMTAAPTSAGFFSKLTASSAALVSSLLLVIGFGSGYLLGNNTDPSAQLASTVQNSASLNSTSQSASSQAPTIVYRDAEPKIIEKERIVTKYITRYVAVPAPAVTAGIAAMPATDFASVNEMPEMSPLSVRAIPTTEPVVEPLMPLQLGEDKLKPSFIGLGDKEEDVPERTLLERFELSFNESFGRQYPNTEATNTTLPLITNSSISVFFQVLPRSNKLWAGASFGTANVTRKSLSTVRTNPFDETEEEIIGEYTHVQTNWIGGFLQYRMPLFTKADLMFTSGYGFAEAGNMAIGEIGMRYDATKDVGFTVGFRGTRLSYDLNDRVDELIRDRKGSLSVPKGVKDATPSYNLELATGLYFHF